MKSIHILYLIIGIVLGLIALGTFAYFFTKTFIALLVIAFFIFVTSIVD